MVTVNDWWTQLSMPFTPAQVSWRFGSMKKDKTAGMAMAYLDARDVMDRLDAVCTPSGWACEYSHVGQVTVCDLKVWCPMGDADDSIDDASWAWISKADGAGNTDIEAEKGALSDAFKRAAVRFGIGRYLYGLDTPWVASEHKYGHEIDADTKAGQLQISKQGYKDLQKHLERHVGNMLDGNLNEKNMLRLLHAQIRRAETAELVDRWIEENRELLRKLKVDYQKNLKQLADARKKTLNECK